MKRFNSCFLRRSPEKVSVQLPAVHTQINWKKSVCCHRNQHLNDKLSKGIGHQPTKNLLRYNLWRGWQKVPTSQPPSVSERVNKFRTVRAVTLTFSGIQQHLIRVVCTKCGTTNFPQSSNIGQNSDKGISDFWISG